MTANPQPPTTEHEIDEILNEHWRATFTMIPSQKRADKKAKAGLTALLDKGVREARDQFHQAYSGSPEEHPVPCEDCGSTVWTDWALPHPVFNAVCPGGNGYLCLPCFVKRMEFKESQTEGSDASVRSA